MVEKIAPMTERIGVDGVAAQPPGASNRGDQIRFRTAVQFHGAPAEARADTSVGMHGWLTPPLPRLKQHGAKPLKALWMTATLLR